MRRHYLSKVTVDDLIFIDRYNKDRKDFYEFEPTWVELYSYNVENMYVYISRTTERFSYNIVSDHDHSYDNYIPIDNIIDLLKEDCPKAYERYLKDITKLGQLL